MITQSELKEFLSYDEKTGLFFRIKSVHNTRLYSECGSTFKHPGVNTLFYKRTQVKGKNYLMHRLAWLYVYGYFPNEIDHINGDGTDNRISNLRSVTRSENMKNKRLYTKNTSGVTGVRWDTDRSKWKAQITTKGKCKTLGRYADIFEAYCARFSALNKADFHYNHGRSA